MKTNSALQNERLQYLPIKNDAEPATAYCIMANNPAVCANNRDQKNNYRKAEIWFGLYCCDEPRIELPKYKMILFKEWYVTQKLGKLGSFALTMQAFKVCRSVREVPTLFKKKKKLPV